MSKTITPNKYKQAVQELATLSIKGFEIPQQISEKEKGYYVCVGVKSVQNKDQMSHTHTAKLLYAMPNLWQEMKRELSTGRVKGLFNGVFNKVVLLHDPTLPTESKDSKPKKVSNVDKNKIKKMHGDGIPANEIAKVLDLEEKKVTEYINKLK